MTKNNQITGATGIITSLVIWFAGVMTDYSRAYSIGWGDYKNNDFETITGNKSSSFQHSFDEVLSWEFKQI